MYPSNDLFFAIYIFFQNKLYIYIWWKYYFFAQNYLQYNKYFLSVFIICIQNVLQQVCPDLPVVFTGFFENCSGAVFSWKNYIILQLIFGTASRGRSSQAASKSSRHMVEQQNAFYAVIFLHVFNSLCLYLDT